MTRTAAWVEAEMATVDLGHEARNQRLKSVIGDLAAMPAASIPAAVGGGRAETEAAYRLFDNEAVEFDAILAPHFHASLERVQQQRRVIVAQDTSEIDLTRPEQHRFTERGHWIRAPDAGAWSILCWRSLPRCVHLKSWRIE
jgi:hypothetical protein